jgi:hypothetical protein
MSCDTVSFFTNVPVNEVLSIICTALETDEKLARKTSLSVDAIT